ncbi:MAG TPA: PQQ-binding-like beta-propeller repeat protein [Pirellulales bacterium]|nr:PQQ-binding-like beta-propeller repeat protein [Pirellulales bacterium]
MSGLRRGGWMGLAAAACLACEAFAAQGDWPQWRGPNRDGVSTETGLLDHWPEKGPPLAWQAKGLGGGYSSVAVADGSIFTMGKRDGKECLIALSAKDGVVLWATPLGGASDPNGTPTVDGERVYAVGLQGDLVCAETANGRIVWQKNYGRDFGGQMMSGWGYSESPLVDGDKLICTPGAGNAILTALDKRTGNVLWKAAWPGTVGDRGKDGAGYSSVVVSQGAGVRQYVQLIGRGLIGVSATDGRVLWTYNRVANGTANIPTPIVKGDFVFCSSGYGTGAALLKLVKDGSGVKAEEQYFLEASKLQNHHGGMVLVGNHVYCGHGHNEGFPLCLEMLTGKIAWEPGRGPGSASAAITCADGHLYFRYQNGVLALIEAKPDMYVLKGSFQIPVVNGNSWPHPVVAGGRLYLRDQDALLCYDIKRK